MSRTWKIQTPQDSVVNFQPIDLVDVILWLVLRPRVGYQQSKYLSICFFIAPSWQFVEAEQRKVKLLLFRYLSRAELPSPYEGSCSPRNPMECVFDTHLPPVWSCTSSVRIINRDCSQAICVVCIRRSAALASGCQSLVPSSLPACRRALPTPFHTHQASKPLTALGAAATAAPERAAPRAGSRRDPSARPPSPACRAATA
jgi:hypothetical protein